MGSALLTLLSLMFGVTLSRFQSSLSLSAFHLDFAKEGASELLRADSRVSGALLCERPGQNSWMEITELGGVHPLDWSWAQGRQSLA